MWLWIWILFFTSYLFTINYCLHTFTFIIVPFFILWEPFRHWIEPPLPLPPPTPESTSSRSQALSHLTSIQLISPWKRIRTFHNLTSWSCSGPLLLLGMLRGGSRACDLLKVPGASNLVINNATSASPLCHHCLHKLVTGVVDQVRKHRSRRAPLHLPKGDFPLNLAVCWLNSYDDHDDQWSWL